MKRAVTKALVLLAVFFGSLTLFIQMFSQEVTVGTADMERSPFRSAIWKFPEIRLTGCSERRRVWRGRD